MRPFPFLQGCGKRRTVEREKGSALIMGFSLRRRRGCVCLERLAGHRGGLSLPRQLGARRSGLGGRVRRGPVGARCRGGAHPQQLLCGEQVRGWLCVFSLLLVLRCPGVLSRAASLRWEARAPPWGSLLWARTRQRRRRQWAVAPCAFLV